MKESSVHTVLIGLGTNLGDRRINLIQACGLISDLGCRIAKSSALYETAPWGFKSNHSFYNQCLVIETELNPEELINAFKRMEAEAGRVQSTDVYKDRIIDIDILLFDDLIINSDELIIPHPRMAKRMFVLIPLLEIAPHKMHPVLKKSIAELTELCLDKVKVCRLPDK
jgi:2-amino-4-hydroxy-6-hydroxymethyldihydropteridine diphosphokinase